MREEGRASPRGVEHHADRGGEHIAEHERGPHAPREQQQSDEHRERQLGAEHAHGEPAAVKPVGEQAEAGAGEEEKQFHG